MPFGLSDALVVFHELMSVVLQGFNDFATAYLDDIFVSCSTLKELCCNILATQTYLSSLTV